MKQNVNGLLAILVTMVYGGLLAIPAVIMLLAGLPEIMVYLALFILAAGSSVPGVIGMLSLADRQYAKLEA
jgi:Ca2+/Na+ antiporter